GASPPRDRLGARAPRGSASASRACADQRWAARFRGRDCRQPAQTAQPPLLAARTARPAATDRKPRTCSSKETGGGYPPPANSLAVDPLWAGLLGEVERLAVVQLQRRAEVGEHRRMLPGLLVMELPVLIGLGQTIF